MFAKHLGWGFRMENALYRGELFHNRMSPDRHTFKYDHACVFADIENIQNIADISPFVSVEKFYKRQVKCFEGKSICSPIGELVE